MEIYDIIIYGFAVILGIYAVLRQISDDAIKKLQKNLLTRWTIAQHFKLSRKINKLISEAVQSGTFGGSLKFLLGVIILFIYFLLVNLVVNLVKLVIYNIWGVFAPNYMLGFSLMLGAGSMAFIVWMKKLHDESKRLKAAWKTKQKGQFIKGSISRGLKIGSLGLTYVIWVFGEALLLNGSPNFVEELQQPMLIFAIFFALFLLCWFFSSSLFSRAEVPSRTDSVPNDGHTIDGSK